MRICRHKSLSSQLLLAGAFFLFLSSTSALEAEWTVEVKIDSMTDKEIREATTRGELGHTFKVVRPEPQGPVVGIFRLAENSGDVLDSENLAMLRVDSRNPIDLSSLARLGITSREPRWITFRLWHGQEEEVGPGLLRDLMEGESLVLRYFLATGGFKEERFSLKGAKAAIAEAIKVSPELSDEAATLAEAKQRDSERFRKAYLQCMELQGRKANKCQEKVLSCSRQFSGEDLRNCLSGVQERK